MNGGGGEARGGFPQVKREFYINQHGQRGKKMTSKFLAQGSQFLTPQI